MGLIAGVLADRHRIAVTAVIVAVVWFTTDEWSRAVEAAIVTGLVVPPVLRALPRPGWIVALIAVAAIAVAAVSLVARVDQAPAARQSQSAVPASPTSTATPSPPRELARLTTPPVAPSASPSPALAPSPPTLPPTQAPVPPPRDPLAEIGDLVGKAIGGALAVLGAVVADELRRFAQPYVARPFVWLSRFLRRAHRKILHKPHHGTGKKH